MPLFRARSTLTRLGLPQVMALTVLLPVAAPSQPIPDNGTGTPTEQSIVTEVLVAPKVVRLNTRDQYPYEEIRRSGEGRVQLGFMVDTAGKPFEVTVEDSTGNKAFEEAATRALERSKFEPGTLNGRPVESASQMQFVFSIIGVEPGADREFINSYKSLIGAIKARDRAHADIAIKAVKIQNLYEDAYFGLASYYYAIAWGNESDQLRGLRRATASDNKPQVWRGSEYDDIVFRYLSLLMKLHHYGEAMATWTRRQKTAVDPSLRAQFKPFAEQLEAIRTNDTEYDVAGAMPDGSWNLLLFKKHFRATVTEGHISDIKLRCQKAFVRFGFDPALEYKVQSKYGDCSIELEGERGTQFALTQF